MIAPADRFARNCAEASLNQIGPASETASPLSRRTTQGPVVTSFGPLPKLPLQDCADGASATLQPVSAGSTETHLPKLEFPNPVSVLIGVPSFGGETTPYGVGENAAGGFSLAHPQGFRARGLSRVRSPDLTTAAPTF